MKTLVTYDTRTGNTGKIAKCIYESLSYDKTLLSMDEVINMDVYDLIFAGFPVYSFGPTPKAKKFLESLPEGINIALFMTLSLTAAPFNDQNTYLYNLTLENCRKVASRLSVLGFFDCPGELSEETANALLKSPDPMLQAFGGMRHYSIGFPNQKNMEDAKIFGEIMFKKFLNQCCPLKSKPI
jgi:flavodoxin